jgi:hypothetical protein
VTEGRHNVFLLKEEIQNTFPSNITKIWITLYSIFFSLSSKTYYLVKFTPNTIVFFVFSCTSEVFNSIQKG